MRKLQSLIKHVNKRGCGVDKSVIYWTTKSESVSKIRPKYMAQSQEQWCWISLCLRKPTNSTIVDQINYNLYIYIYIYCRNLNLGSSMDEGGREKINIKVFYVVQPKILLSTKEISWIFSWANFRIFTHFSIHLQSTSKLWVVNHSWEGNWPVWHILTALTNLIICSNINRIQYNTTCSNLDTCTTD